MKHLCFTYSKVLSISRTLCVFKSTASSCFDRNDAEEQSACLVEAYRLLRSTAYQLHLVMQQNLVVRDLVSFFSTCGVGV